MSSKFQSISLYDYSYSSSHILGTVRLRSGVFKKKLFEIFGPIGSHVNKERKKSQKLDNKILQNPNQFCGLLLGSCKNVCVWGGGQKFHNYRSSTLKFFALIEVSLNENGK